MEPRELLAPLVLLAVLASPDQEEDPDPRALRVLLDLEACLEILVFRVSRETPVPKESLATLDLREPPDLRVRKAREDPLVSLVPLALLVPVELEALLAAVACLVLREELAPLVCLVPVVQLVQLDLVDPLEMLVVLVRLAQLVSGVSQEALETLDPQERRDLLVLLDKMAAPDLPAQQDLEASLETLVFPDPKDRLGSLASLVRREPLAPLD